MATLRAGFGRESAGNIATDIAQKAVFANGGYLLSLQKNAKYLSGARTLIKVNDRIFGFAFAVSWNIETDVTEIRTVDDLSAFELGPKKISVSGSMSSLILPGDSPQADIQQADALSFIFDKYITIEVSDSTTGNLIFRTDTAIVTSSQGQIGPEGLGNMTLNWKAVLWINEKSPEYPKSEGTNAISGSGIFEPGDSPNGGLPLPGTPNNMPPPPNIA